LSIISELFQFLHNADNASLATIDTRKQSIVCFIICWIKRHQLTRNIYRDGHHQWMSMYISSCFLLGLSACHFKIHEKHI